MTAPTNSVTPEEIEQAIETVRTCRTRDDVVPLYASFILRGAPSWQRLNEAIARRWSFYALDWIKTRAWREISNDIR